MREFKIGRFVLAWHDQCDGLQITYSRNDTVTQAIEVFTDAEIWDLKHGLEKFLREKK